MTKIISEAINYSLFTERIIHNIYTAIALSIDHVMKHNAMRKLQSHEKVDANTFQSILTNEIDITDVLQFFIPQELEKFTNKVLKTKQYYIKFEKLPIGTDGIARATHFSLSDIYLTHLSIKLSNFLTTLYEKTDNVEHLIQVLDYRKKNLNSNPKTYLSSNIYDTVYEMATTSVHELVHLKQNKEQPSTQKQYRSYLQKSPEEFRKSFARDDNNELVHQELHDKLYVSSPQEIAAFAHTFAIQILQPFIQESDAEFSETWKYYITHKNEFLEDIETNINTRINSFMRQHGVLPTGFKERMIYKRYKKLVYKEIWNYFITRGNEVLSK